MERQLGLVRAVVIVWLSGTFATIVLALFVSPVGWALIAGSARRIDQQWGLAATLVVADALLAGIVATFGVRLLGFRLSYLAIVAILAIGGIVSNIITRFLLARSASDPTGIALPVVGAGLSPLQLLLAILIPAILINMMASPIERHPEASREGQPPPPIPV